MVLIYRLASAKLNYYYYFEKKRIEKEKKTKRKEKTRQEKEIHKTNLDSSSPISGKSWMSAFGTLLL
jgi:hypothetical protein